MSNLLKENIFYLFFIFTDEKLDCYYFLVRTKLLSN